MGCQVTIYTRVYNTERFLPQCLNSVIEQSYRNFQHLIFDNGCTDSCTKLLQDYADQYPWVRLIRFEKNKSSIDYMKWIHTPYITSLDSDDWWEPDFLERMINFLEANNLDLAVTGTMQYIDTDRASRIMRKLEQPVVLEQQQFAENYPFLWTFPSTIWATIRKTDLIHKIDYSSIAGYPYGGDTLEMIEYLKQCSRIGIDNSALYHYRIHSKSVTYQYDLRRFDANIACYEQIKDFLELHHTFDHQKQEWLKRVHLTSMLATLQLLRDAKILGDEKVAECARIAAHPLTAVALTNDCDERKQWYALMRGIVFHGLSSNAFSDVESLRTVLKVLSPRCYGAVQSENLGLFARVSVLFDSLQKDDWEQLVCQLMELIVQKRYSKQYDLGQMLGGLVPVKTPLEGMTDTRFFREYADICMLVLSENYSAALEQMTGLLLDGEKLYAVEAFLKLYLSLAALEEQAPAFLFGKMRLAWFYLRQGRLKECRAAVAELVEMGLDDEELTALRRELEDAQ